MMNYVTSILTLPEMLYPLSCKGFKIFLKNDIRKMMTQDVPTLHKEIKNTGNGNNMGKYMTFSSSFKSL